MCVYKALTGFMQLFCMCKVLSVEGLQKDPLYAKASTGLTKSPLYVQSPYGLYETSSTKALCEAPFVYRLHEGPPYL